MFHTPGKIDLLIGIKLFFVLLLPSRLRISDELPVLQETRLGWIIAGAVGDVDPFSTQQHCNVITLKPCIESSEAYLKVIESSAMIGEDPDQLVDSKSNVQPSEPFPIRDNVEFVATELTPPENLSSQVDDQVANTYPARFH